MTWIRVIPFDQDENLRLAREAQQKLYPIEYAQPTHPHHAQTDGIVASHSLIPDALYHAFAAFGSLMSPELPLSRPAARDDHDGRLGDQPVPVLTGVSRRVSASRDVDETLVEALKADYRSAPISKEDRIMLEYVEQITRDATAISPAFHDRLREAGFDDSRHSADHLDCVVVQLHQSGR
jgi:hypothetical protein